MESHVLGDAGRRAAVRRGELGTTAEAAVLGKNIGALADEAGHQELAKVYAVEHELLKDYTADGYTAALAATDRIAQPASCYFRTPTRFAISCPTGDGLDRVVVSDVVAHRVEDGSLTLVRQLFQGKLNGDVRFTGDGPHFASLQAGAYRADRVVDRRSADRDVAPVLAPSQIRTVRSSLSASRSARWI